jgi:hypothetical protein
VCDFAAKLKFWSTVVEEQKTLKIPGEIKIQQKISTKKSRLLFEQTLNKGKWWARWSIQLIAKSLDLVQRV